MKMQITFKSGAQIAVDVEEFNTGISRVSDRLVSLRWTHAANPSAKLKYIADLDDIAAIVALHEPGDEAEPEAAGAEEIVSTEDVTR